MTQVIVFPDAVQWLSEVLPDRLASFGSYARVSDTYAGEPIEVWLQRDGGPVLDLVRETQRIRVNVFREAESVGDFAALVGALIRACPDGLPVLRARQVVGPTPIPDIRPRRYMLFELTVRGTALD